MKCYKENKHIRKQLVVEGNGKGPPKDQTKQETQP